MNMHTLRLRFSLLLGLAIAVLVSVPTAFAYLTPEEVLLNEELYLPPRTRESLVRIERQQRSSETRREREQEVIFGVQRAREEEEMLAAAAPPFDQPSLDDLSAFDVELLRTIRLIERVEGRQRTLKYAEPLHGGAPLYGPRPDLAPTGAGGIVSAFAMLSAVAWTMRRAKKAEQQGVTLLKSRR